MLVLLLHIHNPHTHCLCCYDRLFCSCRVCGDWKNEALMLLCGTADGSAGCGTGYHIFCLDPPLGCVPAGDWFCPQCEDDSDDQQRVVNKGA